MNDGLVMRLRPGFTLVDEGGDSVSLVAGAQRTRLRVPAPGLRAALVTLGTPGASEDQLVARLLAGDGAAELPRLFLCLLRLARWRLLWYDIVADGATLFSLEPVQLDTVLRPERQVGAHRLSRFAYQRRVGAAVVLESPLATARAYVHDARGAVLLARLAHPCTPEDLASAAPGPPAAIAQMLLGALSAVELVGAVDAQGRLPEDRDPALRLWDFHDLLFHAQSRFGRTDQPLGATYRLRDELEALPAARPAASAEVVPLRAPDLDQLALADWTLTRTLACRRSRRTYGQTPITLAQLAEFLYRVSHVQATVPPDPSVGLLYEASRRPTPSGGGVHELELYVAVRACTGLAPGIYRHDPYQHRLERLPAPVAAVDALLSEAEACGALPQPSQVLIIVAARFQRSSWKYSGLAYALTLKHVGVLQQTMYLVATAMGLAPCALGAGNVRLFAEATGNDYVVESSVGEFLLGSAPGAGH